MEESDIHWGFFVWQYVLCGLIAVLYVIAERFYKHLKKTENRRRIKDIRKDPALAKTYKNTLDIYCGSLRGCDAAAFARISARIRSRGMIGEAYNMLYAYALNQYELLVFTEYIFEVDYDEEDGKTRHEKVDHNFLLRFVPAKNEIRSFSTVHHTAADKLQKEEFLRVFQWLVGNEAISWSSIAQVENH